MSARSKLLRAFRLGQRGGRALDAHAARTWLNARPSQIEAALRHALTKASGGWFALDSSSRLRRSRRPRAYRVDGRELVVWSALGQLHVAPNRCPHMGARLDEGHVCDGAIVCPWHGLALGAGGHGAWQALSSYDDGALLWARFETEDELAGDASYSSTRYSMPEEQAVWQRPPLPQRPERHLSAVARIEVDCDPEDIVARRLDPWFGLQARAPQIAAREVIEESDERIVIRADARVFGPRRESVELSIECPSARSVVMTSLSGPSAGSTIETHATPIAEGKTAVVEATFVATPAPDEAPRALSRRVASACASRMRRALGPWLSLQTRRRWRGDTSYVERLCELRRQAGRSAELAPQSELV